MKSRFFALLVLLSSSSALIEAQNIDVRALAEEDLFRSDALSEEAASARNSLWEAVSLSLLVQEVEAAAAAAGLEDLRLAIDDNAVNIIYRDIRFLPGSSDLTATTEEKIRSIVGILGRFLNMTLLVEGHTAKLSADDTDDGLELSQERARSVAALVRETGVFESQNIESVGRGFYEPIAGYETPEGRALNRRVEINIINNISDDSMAWWDVLSNPKLPGFTVYLVPDANLESLRNRLEAEGIGDLTFAETPAGVAIVDDTILYNDDNELYYSSYRRMQQIGSLLPVIHPETQVRIGGYGTYRSIDEVEERHFLTAYTLGAIAGFRPDALTYSAAPYFLTEATAALAVCELSTADGNPIELRGDGSLFTATLPYSVDSFLIDVTTEDPHAKIVGLSEDAVALVPGNNEIVFTIESAARDLTVSQSYRLAVVRQDPELRSLSIRSEDRTISLSPGFAPTIQAYRADVPSYVSDVDVVAALLPEDEAAGAAISITKTYQQGLQPGENAIEVVVSDGNSTASTYSITIVREAGALTTLSSVSVQSGNDTIDITPAFSPEITTYTAVVPYTVESVTINVTSTDEEAILEADHADVALSVGDNLLTTTVTDQLGGFATDYSLVIRRAPLAAATLQEVSVTAPNGDAIDITPALSPEITTYTAVVPYTVESVTINVTPTDEEAILEGDHAEVALSVGDNLLTTTVTDQLGGFATD